MAYVIAVANQKGGVAKTTTVVSLAGALVKLDKEVLAVDMDAQANLTLALGVDPAQAHSAIDDVLQNTAGLASVSRETYIPGLDLVPANSKMDLAERFLPLRPNYEVILREALTAGVIQQTYDYVVMDCPPSMGAVTLNALVAADLLIIPTQSEYFSAHALRAVMSAVKRVRMKQNPSLVYRILITMHDRRNRIHRTLSEQIRATFRDGVFQTMIETDTKLRESSVAGLPITHYYAKSRSSLQYDALAQELIEHVQEKNPSPA